MWWLLAPLLKFLPSLNFIGPIFGVITAVAAWIWQNVFWPGLQVLFSSLASILTLGTIVGGLYFYGDHVYDAKVYELAQCQQLVDKVNKGRPVKTTPIEKFLKNFDILP